MRAGTINQTACITDLLRYTGSLCLLPGHAALHGAVAALLVLLPASRAGGRWSCLNHVQISESKIVSEISTLCGCLWGSLTRFVQTEFIVDFFPPSCKGNMGWRERVISDAVPGSAHKSSNLSSFPDLYFHTISLFPDINPKPSHLSCA